MQPYNRNDELDHIDLDIYIYIYYIYIYTWRRTETEEELDAQYTYSAFLTAFVRAISSTIIQFVFGRHLDPTPAARMAIGTRFHLYARILIACTYFYREIVEMLENLLKIKFLSF